MHELITDRKLSMKTHWTLHSKVLAVLKLRFAYGRANEGTTAFNCTMPSESIYTIHTPAHTLGSRPNHKADTINSHAMAYLIINLKFNKEIYHQSLLILTNQSLLDPLRRVSVTLRLQVKKTSLTLSVLGGGYYEPMRMMHMTTTAT